MKAVVWHAPGQIDLQEVPDARIEQPSDAVVRLTMSAICGTDLHMVRGTMADMVAGTVLGHEGVGVVEAVGDGVYPPTMRTWPIGAAMNKNLTVKMGNCPHRTIIPQLVELVASGVADPARLVTQIEPINDVTQAYRTFDTREPGWVKVALAPVA